MGPEPRSSSRLLAKAGDDGGGVGMVCGQSVRGPGRPLCAWIATARLKSSMIAAA